MMAFPDHLMRTAKGTPRHGLNGAKTDGLIGAITLVYHRVVYHTGLGLTNLIKLIKEELIKIILLLSGTVIGAVLLVLHSKHDHLMSFY